MNRPIGIIEADRPSIYTVGFVGSFLPHHRGSELTVFPRTHTPLAQGNA